LLAITPFHNWNICRRKKKIKASFSFYHNRSEQAQEKGKRERVQKVKNMGGKKLRHPRSEKGYRTEIQQKAGRRRNRRVFGGAQLHAVTRLTLDYGRGGLREYPSGGKKMKEGKKRGGEVLPTTSTIPPYLFLREKQGWRGRGQ